MRKIIRRLWLWFFPPFDRAAHERDCEELAGYLEDHHADW